VNIPNVNLPKFYHGFWDGSEYCTYMNISDCKTILGDATIDGGNMVTSYLVLQFDAYYTVISGRGSIFTQSNV